MICKQGTQLNIPQSLSGNERERGTTKESQKDKRNRHTYSVKKKNPVRMGKEQRDAEVSKPRTGSSKCRDSKEAHWRCNQAERKAEKGGREKKNEEREEKRIKKAKRKRFFFGLEDQM